MSTATSPDEPEPPLTAREREILDLVARGMTNEEIADRLAVSVRIVEDRLSEAETKLGTVSGTDLGALWREMRHSQSLPAGSSPSVGELAAIVWELALRPFGASLTGHTASVMWGRGSVRSRYWLLAVMTGPCSCGIRTAANPALSSFPGALTREPLAGRCGARGRGSMMNQYWLPAVTTAL